MDNMGFRFLQRLDSYNRAFTKLEELVTIFLNNSEINLFNNLESGLDQEIARESLIKRFEFTQELSWNLLKDYLKYEGEQDLGGSRDVYRRALKYHLINDAKWMDMISDRNISAHDYNDNKVAEISDRILNIYYPLLKELLEMMSGRASTIRQGN